MRDIGINVERDLVQQTVCSVRSASRLRHDQTESITSVVLQEVRSGDDASIYAYRSWLNVYNHLLHHVGYPVIQH